MTDPFAFTARNVFVRPVIAREVVVAFVVVELPNIPFNPPSRLVRYEPAI